MKKVCSKCNIEKELSEFHKKKAGKFGVSSECKLCNKEYRKENADKIKESNKEYYKKNAEKKKEYRKENAEKNKEYQKEYYKENAEKNKEYQKEYHKEKYNNDPQYRFKHNLSSNIRTAFKLYTKNGKTMSCAKYEIDFKAIYEHVGPKPEGDFHLDHIIPVNAFDYDNPEHVRLAHLPQNLRWIGGSENCSKSDTIDWELINSNETLKEIAKQIGITNEKI